MNFETLVDAIRRRGASTPDRLAMRFVRPTAANRFEREDFTYRELDAVARSVAVRLRSYCEPGQRILLLCPPGVEYIMHFYGCLYAGLVPVPAYPPASNRHLSRVETIARSARAGAVLTAEGADRLGLSTIRGSEIPTLAAATWIEAGRGNFTAPAHEWEPPDIEPDTTALLQYTSGSTSAPKGVVVSHANLLNNARIAEDAFGITPDSIGAGWLPPYHDMGLLGGLVSPIYSGFPVVVISPMTFVRDPLYWLEVMAHEGATSSAGPNFAYQLCVDHADPERLATLDLSRWESALNGSEPVRAEVLDAFAETFAPCGFRRSAFYPCYGLAEATLLVSGGRPAGDPAVVTASADELEQGRVTAADDGTKRVARLVGSGRVAAETEVAIVDPATRTVLPEGRVGAVWIRGISVAAGYFENETATEDTFRRYTDTGDGPYLDPGDLGCLVDGQLFIVGRTKEAMNFRGRNVYPQDVEAVSVGSHPGLAGTRCVAFAIEVGGEDRLVVVQQKPRRARREFTDAELVAAVRRAVSEHFQLAAYDILLVPARAIPVTSSGKLQRAQCRRQYLDGEFGGVITASEPPATSAVPDAAVSEEPRPRRGRREIEAFMVAAIARHSGLAAEEIDVREQFATYGLGSIQAVRIAADLSEELGIDIPPTLAWEHPSIVQAAAALAELAGETFGGAAIFESRTATDEPIAVVGVGCRFPGGVEGAEEFWELLVTGRSGVGEVPGDRWDVAEFYDADPDAPGRTYSRHGGFLSDVRGFDAGLFGISAREAASMDPQQRLVLETAWQALEHAGIAPDALRGSGTGVFVGMSGGDYERVAARARGIDAIDAYVATGNAGNFGANRLSYALGLAGPSLVVDTACSSSLVAVHLAAQSLRGGECELALAGGVNVMLSPEVTMALSKGRMLSPSGGCRTFDAAADGYVRGEGCGFVVLRRLSDAIANGDRVLCVVRGSAVNQDGRSSGLTAPSMVAQQAVVQRALAAAGLEPERVGYVEAHGTGTPLGDPIELRALAAVLGSGRDENPLRVGSVKTNIGHLEAAAGIAGFIKAALAVSRGVIPPHLNLREPTPHVDWDRLGIEVPRRVTPWAEPERVAGVSSFGFGGTNAHVVLATPETVEVVAPQQRSVPKAEVPVVVKLAGADPGALAATAERLAELVAGEPTLSPAQVAWAANTRRADLPVRAAVIAGSRRELLDGLRDTASGNGIRGRRRRGGAPRVAFVAPGHGTRIAGALAGIYGVVPVVTEVLDSLGSVAELPLSVLVRTGDEVEAALSRTEVAQPALYAMAVALGQWWRSVGVEPDVVTGHSVGAYAAAALAGVFSIADGAALIAARGTAMGALADGDAMAAIGCAPAELAELAPSDAVTVAVVNAATEIVVAGPGDAVDAVVAAAGERGIKARRLPVGRAFHSRAVEPALPMLRAAFENIELCQPTIDFVSDTTGEVVTGEPTEVEYWLTHTRQPVRFDAAVATVHARRADTVVELGPGGLLSLLATHPDAREPLCVPSAGTADPHRRLLESLARVWADGSRIDWAATQFVPDRIPELPTYPFQRVPYWITDEHPIHAEAATPEPGGEVAYTVDAEIDRLQTELARLLGLPAGERVDPDAGLFDVGLTSAMAVELLTTLRATHTVPLPPTVVFEHPTIARLAAYLSSQAAATAPARRRATPSAEPIAIVGMACRFPGGADDLDGYWDLLISGRDGTGPVPADRPWLRTDGPEFRAGFLDVPVADFDAEAFGISPREARGMDPQQRLLLEVVWEALDDAGIARDRLRGAAGSVYVGMNTTDYLQLLAAERSTVDPYFATGNTFSVAAGRVSYLLGLRGPSMAIDTACSSSLVATDHAVTDLRTGRADIAVVGGVNLILSPATTSSLSSMGALAADGRCKTFDATADGYGRGEGCGVLILKRLSDARRDGDRIWALVRGSEVNQDGRSAGLTVPSGTAQAEVISGAVRAAGVTPQSVGYVEAHGTGTPLGDPIELAAMTAALRPDPDAAPPLVVGSAKTNVGHLEAAAGVCGLIKLALSLWHKRIPPHLHYRDPNPAVPWGATPVVIPTEPVPWPEHADGRIGGVSSFGFSGTNAHVILQEAPAPTVAEPAAATGDPELVVVSAATPESLRDNAIALADRLGDELAVRDVAATLARHRTIDPYRAAVVADSLAALRTALGGVSGAETVRATARSRTGLVFVYSGQGGQWPGLGARVLAEPLLRATLEDCDAIVRRAGNWSLLAEFGRPEGQSRLDDTRYAQAAICAVQIALTDLWARWGIRPGAVVGHSVGEIAAGYAAGALTREAALRLAVARGAAMADTRGRGAMVAIGLPVARVRELLDGDEVCVAAVNGPAATVLAGPVEAVDEIARRAAAHGAPTRTIQSDYAFHSPQMAAAANALPELIAEVPLRAPAIRFYSTSLGRRAEQELTDPAYWAAAVTRPVLFAAALAAAVDEGVRDVLEIGPDRTLAGAVRQTPDLTYVPTMVRDNAVRRSTLDAAGRLLEHGHPVALEALYPAGGYRRLDLPAYRWHRQRHWLPTITASATAVDCDLYDIDWRATESVTAAVPPGSRWLLVADGGELAGRLARELTVAGATAETITPGTEVPAGEFAGAIVLPSPGTGRAPEAVSAEIHRATSAVLGTVQAWLAGGRTGRVFVVTRGAVPAADHPLTVEHAPLWGLARTIGLEHPALWGAAIDLDPASADPDGDALAVLAQITGDTVEDQVAFRGDRRLVPRLRRATTTATPPPELDSDAAYLVTGGLGSLGLRIADWLVRRGARHLVLLGRRDPADHPAEVRDALAALRERGVRVHTPAADVADPRRMAEVFDGDTDWPPVRGVVHAAGALDAAPIASMGMDQFDAVLRAKVQGALVLDSLAALADTDFFVLFSSAAAVWGSALAGHYCAANHFLDMLAWDRRARGRTATAIDWGWWRDSAMAAGHGEYFAAMGMSELAPDTALAVLDTLVGGAAPQTVAAPVDWSRFLPVMQAKRQRPLLADMAGSGGGTDGNEAAREFVTRLGTFAPAARRRALEDALQREVATVLGRSERTRLDPRQGFFESGMDSITSVELKTRVERLIGRPIPVTTVFEHPTIADLTTYLLTLVELADPETPGGAAPSENAADDLLDLSEAELLELLDQELDTGRIDDKH
ncbi:SDR family NAD(P)-dependent oxidoreductase [Nocardia sp. NPDC003482]